MIESVVPVVIFVLAVGVVIGLVPMEPRLKTVAVVLVILAVCLWLLRSFGLWG